MITLPADMLAQINLAYGLSLVPTIDNAGRAQESTQNSRCTDHVPSALRPPLTSVDGLLLTSYPASLRNAMCFAAVSDCTALKVRAISKGAEVVQDHVIANEKLAAIRDMESDLASIALNAATELDNLVLGRQTTFCDLQRLTQKLTDSFGHVSATALPSYLIDPTEVVVMRRAMKLSAVQTQLVTVDELVGEASKIVERLRSISETPGGTALPEAQKMRDFCLALSRAASVYQVSLDEPEQAHPFRR